jgi:hypothetical protein
MLEFSQEFDSLRFLMVKLARLEGERIEVLNSNLPPAMKDEQDAAIKNQMEIQRKSVSQVLKTLLEFPPQHIRHKPKLESFHGVADFEKSVFVMTKFPDPNSNAVIDQELKAVINAVCQAVQARGFKARLASDGNFHPQLWDNVELYLLGSRRGIAIVEDKYLPELNPNVAMEWGWMRGMGRDVLYLVEKGFNKQRADWGGLIEKQFDWANPAADIKASVEEWLSPP